MLSANISLKINLHVSRKENLFVPNEISLSHYEKRLWENENEELKNQLKHHYIILFFENEFFNKDKIFLH
jgi:hypothetical protein